MRRGQRDGRGTPDHTQDIELSLTRISSKHDSQLTLVGSALISLCADVAPHGAAEHIVAAYLAHPSVSLVRLQAGMGAAA